MKGHTLIEVVVAMALLGMVMTTLLLDWQMLQRASGTQQALREGREAARILLDSMVSDIQGAIFIWTGTNVVNGHAYQVPAPAPAPPATGTELLYARPEVAADGSVTAGALTYTVVGVYLQPMEPPDEMNPGAQEVEIERFPGQTPTRADEPASIDLTRLDATVPGYVAKVYRPYLTTSNWLAVLSPPRAVYFDLTFFRLPANGPVQTEHLTTEAAMRNSQ